MGASTGGSCSSAGNGASRPFASTTPSRADSRGDGPSLPCRRTRGDRFISLPGVRFGGGASLVTKDEGIGVLKKCYDPEVPINIYDLGVVCKLELDEPAAKDPVRMHLTAPACPAA